LTVHHHGLYSGRRPQRVRVVRHVGDGVTVEHGEIGAVAGTDQPTIGQSQPCRRLPGHLPDDLGQCKAVIAE